ncbi:hypothetical protein HDV00_003212 [Rhizophlyctis rosea]|nr:hypothetical protein HDV00_003212 [Rhizophlyctis rosea]
MKRPVVKRRKRIYPASAMVVSPYETNAWANGGHEMDLRVGDVETGGTEVSMVIEQSGDVVVSAGDISSTIPPPSTSLPLIAPRPEGASHPSLPSLKSILPLDALRRGMNGSNEGLTSASPAGDFTINARTLPFPTATIIGKLPSSVFSIASLLDTSSSAATASQPSPSAPVTITSAPTSSPLPQSTLTVNPQAPLGKPSTPDLSNLTAAQISEARTALLKEIEALNELITQKAGQLLGLEKAERILRSRDEDEREGN